ncbi:MAG: response regulator, partial [Elusimicrobiota bacterium]
ASGVGNAAALSRRAARRAPDAVLCDAILPDGDGIEVCRRLKILRPALTVMIMAWDSESGVRARQAALGPVLIKPFSPEELRDALTLGLFSRLKITLSRAVTDLKTQNAEIRSLINDPPDPKTREAEE